jgi:hypothetical protein
LLGGLYSATPATRDDGDVATLQTTATGELLTQTTIVGSLANKQKDKVALASTDLLSDYTALTYQKSILMFATDTAGILSLEVDGVMKTLNSGIALTANAWYTFELPLFTGSVYNLQISVGATVQILWEVI